MRQVQRLSLPSCERQTERGMALVSVLLISTLLLTAGGLLLLTASMSTTNSADSAAEMQAYYAAEAGLQRTLNVLRSRDIPAGTMQTGQTELTFRDIAWNKTLDKWIPFDGPTIDGAKTTLIGTNAYSVLVTDPDDQGSNPLTKLIAINPTYEPSRLNIQVTGYGPRRAKKVLNMIVTRGGLNGFKAPATITVLGSALPLPAITFNTGESESAHYTGNDAAGGAGVSAFAVLATDVPLTLKGIQKSDQVIGPALSVLGPTSPIAGLPPTPKPEWLESADNAREFLYDKEEGLLVKASKQGRYFKEQPDVSKMSDPKQITFVDGDVNLGSGDQGAGLLVVTGKLTTNGNTNFKGVIYVLGEGYVERSGGGDGVIRGGIVVAKFGRTSGDFEAPTFLTKGGGNSLVQYDSKAVGEAMSALPGFEVVGVVEK
jgi:hypothetical protein